MGAVGRAFRSVTSGIGRVVKSGVGAVTGIVDKTLGKIPVVGGLVKGATGMLRGGTNALVGGAVGLANAPFQMADAALGMAGGAMGQLLQPGQRGAAMSSEAFMALINGIMSALMGPYNLLRSMGMIRDSEMLGGPFGPSNTHNAAHISALHYGRML